MAFPFKSALFFCALGVFALGTLGFTSLCLGQTTEQTPAPSQEQQLSGSITGTVVDVSGAVVAGARVKLARSVQSSKDQSSKDQPSKDQSSNNQSSNQSPNQEMLSGGEGQFSFSTVAPGPFQLTITSAGFAAQVSFGILHSGENYIVPQVRLAVASTVTDVEVSLTRTELAEKEIKVEEKQRVLGFVPNFYVSYVPDAVPLTPKQKFEIAWKMSIDPV